MVALKSLKAKERENVQIQKSQDLNSCKEAIKILTELNKVVISQKKIEEDHINELTFQVIPENSGLHSRHKSLALEPNPAYKFKRLSALPKDTENITFLTQIPSQEKKEKKQEEAETSSKKNKSAYNVSKTMSSFQQNNTTTILLGKSKNIRSKNQASLISNITEPPFVNNASLFLPRINSTLQEHKNKEFKIIQKQNNILKSDLDKVISFK